MIIKIKPLSANQAWQGRRFKTDKYKGFEKEMLLKMPGCKFDFGKRLKIEIVFGFSSVLSDIDNPEKMLLDCIQKKYGINDRYYFEKNTKKEIVKKGEEFIQFKISEL